MKRALLAMFVLVMSCGDNAPRAQWKIEIATNAPVPQLGEQVFIEVLQGTNVVDRRSFDGSRASVWPLSFGVIAADPPPRLHVRFFRTAITGADSLPSTAAMIDATAQLPPAGEAITSVAMVLDAACFGISPDVPNAMTCDPSAGDLEPEPTLAAIDPSALPAPGSWQGAATVDCTSDAPDGMICIPGGAFILGAPTYTLVPAAYQPVPERLVVLSPFAIDADEMTVGTYRKLIGKPKVKIPVLQDPMIGSAAQYCTYVGNVAAADAMPVNCIDWDSANAACVALGKRLPTEAEWEFVAGNRTSESLYPWGDDTNVCAYAIDAREDTITANSSGNVDCRQSGSMTFPAGPVAGGSPLDVTDLGVRNLGGNLNEWLADNFDSYTSSCWSNVNPLCVHAAVHVTRGGAWPFTRAYAVVTFREDPVTDGPEASTGVRCAIDLSQ